MKGLCFQVQEFHGKIQVIARIERGKATGCNNSGFALFHGSISGSDTPYDLWSPSAAPRPYPTHVLQNLRREFNRKDARVTGELLPSDSQALYL
jgi:hypothetical protein